MVYRMHYNYVHVQWMLHVHVQQTLLCFIQTPNIPEGMLLFCVHVHQPDMDPPIPDMPLIQLTDICI